jgi:hypothetical protein
MRKKTVHGFQTGDMVEAVIPKGKYKGVHIGLLTGLLYVKLILTYSIFVKIN